MGKTTRHIYGLRLKDGPVRYVGQTKKLSNRLRGILEQRKCGPLLQGWVDRHGDAIEQFVIESCSPAEVDAKEIFWIGHYRREGHALLNIMPGGRTCQPRPGEARELMTHVKAHWAECDFPPDTEDMALVTEILQRTPSKSREAFVERMAKHRIANKASKRRRKAARLAKRKKKPAKTYAPRL